MTARFIRLASYLLLHSTIHFSTKAIDVKFWDIHLGFLGLSPAKEFASPVPKHHKAVGISLTHWNREAQFLCCSISVRTLYQAELCLKYTANQAHNEGIRLGIGGSV